jgi:hypothetical protein
MEQLPSHLSYQGSCEETLIVSGVQNSQIDLFGHSDQDLILAIAEEIRSLLNNNVMLGPSELLCHLEEIAIGGWRARWVWRKSVAQLRDDRTLTRAQRDYLSTVLADEELDATLRCGVKLEQQFKSSIDDLVQRSQLYRDSAKFQECVQFAARFREYKPFNNMLVRLQNPSCSFYATEKHWRTEFGCKLKEDARPLLILAPKHPILLVYELDSVDNPPLPEKLEEFARVEGEWDSSRLEYLVENAERWEFRTQFRPLSSTHGGFVTHHRGPGNYKMRIVIHDGLDEPSRYGVLCHEIAHVLLGHLGADRDLWWPSRMDLTHSTLEIEAEATAFIVMDRAGLHSTSHAYVAGHLNGGEVPASVSLELIMRVAGKIEEMSTRFLPAPKHRKEPRKKSQ